MPRTKRWNWNEVWPGFSEISLSSWKYFGDFIYQEMQNYNNYVWRGHRCDNWKLESTLDRLLRTAKVSAAKLASFEERHLEQFKYAARGRRGVNPPLLEGDDAWWALGQHHGLATPLLDWTTSPYVAAFFAFVGEGSPQTSHRAIYALHRPTVVASARLKARLENTRRREQLSELEKSGKKLGIFQRVMLETKAEPEVVFVRPLSDENQRLVNQGGLFTRSPANKTLDVWIQENRDPESTGLTLLKILVPNKDRDNSLRSLNRMNINHLSLFPDLAGASMFCNIHSEVDRY
jgi:hypothetical protein